MERADRPIDREAQTRHSDPASRRRALAVGLFVTFLWSTSWVLIKLGLPEIRPLSFAALRYALASACLLPVLWFRRRELAAWRSRQWALLCLLGVLLYAVTQGGQFLSLAYLEATTVGLCLSMTTVVVAAGSYLTRRESPNRLQWVGIAVVAVGAVAFFVRGVGGKGNALGFAFAAATVIGNAAAAGLGRSVNRARLASPAVVTAVSMSVGAALLLATALATEGLPTLSLRAWGIVLWLAVANTAFAFALWNWTLRTLSAVESSILNNTMLVQVAVLAFAFLGERYSFLAIAGLLCVAVGTALVQWPRRRRASGSSLQA